MKTKTITLTVEEWEQVAKAVKRYEDHGWEGNGYQSDELDSAAMALARELGKADGELPPQALKAGSKIIVRQKQKRPFRAKVVGYEQCPEGSVMVDKWSGESWVVRLDECEEVKL